MIPFLRSQFNDGWSPEKYRRFLSLLEQRFGEPPPFRHSETPCFLTKTLVDDATRIGRELVDQLVTNADYLAASREAIPEKYRTPGGDPVPLFVQADFGLNEQQELKLVEIQGFPSLYAYQRAMSDAYREAYAIDEALEDLPGGVTAREYRDLLGRAIVGAHEPENVVLLELDPDHQKTRHDFRATSEMLGIAVLDARAVVKNGRRLFYTRNGTLVPIERIYNRVIGDELERRNVQLPFSFQDSLDVEWAGHPNWFFQLSKFSLPYLKHEAVPASIFLDEADAIDDLSQWVLKPLFSFAGTGVIVGPTKQDIENVAGEDRRNYILQERVNFTPWIDTPEGRNKIEIRVMYIWLDELRPVNLIIRMGRGAQMGVDFNKGLGWVGASAAFIYAGENA